MGHDMWYLCPEIEAVLPETLQPNDNGYKAVKYEKLVPLLIQRLRQHYGR
jgi:hypothetical protein